MGDDVPHLESLLLGASAAPEDVEEAFRLLGTPPDPDEVDRLLERVDWSPTWSPYGSGTMLRRVDDRHNCPLEGTALVVWMRLLELASPSSRPLLKLQGEVTSLHLSFAGLADAVDLSALRRLPKLVRLEISGAPALVGDRLGEHGSLQYLRLDRCGSVPPFAFTSLRELDLMSVGAALDTSTLRGASSLETLCVFASEMVGPLPPLPALRTLDVANVYGKWQDLASAAALPLLVELKICLHRGTVDLQPLRAARDLRTLRVTFLGEEASLRGLEACTRLERLDVSGTALRTLASLRGLPLRDLFVQRCQIPSVEDLGDSTQLATLQFNEAPALREVGHLAACRDLQRLVLMSVPALASLDGLQGCPALKDLWILEAAVDDLRPLAGLEALEHLDVSNCTRLRSLEPLAELPALKRISAWGTRLSSRKIPARLRPLLER